MNDAPNIRSLVNYSFIALPLAFAGLPLYMHMPDYYARSFGISLGTLGIILLVIRLFDGIQDPLIGYFCDKIPEHRKRIIMSGLALMIGGIAALYIGPPVMFGALFWFSFAMILATTGFSILTININLIGGFWSGNTKTRIAISSWREGFGLIGLLTAAITPSVLGLRFPDHITFPLLFGLFFILICVGYALFMKFLSEHASLSSKTGAASNFAFISILIKRDPAFFVICFISYFAASVPAAITLFFIRDYLNAENYAGLFLALYFISGAVFIGAWSNLARRYGGWRTWLFAHLLTIVTFGWAAFLTPNDIIAYAAICILSGTALGADLAFPPALLAARIDRSARRDDATQYYAALSFLPKFALALAAFGTLVTLDIFGFNAGSENSPEALRVLLVCYAIIPCIIKAISAMLISNMIIKEGPRDENFKGGTPNGTTHVS